MLTGVYRDFAASPEAHQQRLRDRDSYFGEVLAAPFGSAGDGHHRLRAVIGHATSFWTWRSLCIDHGLPDTEAVDAMTGMVLALTPAPRPNQRSKAPRQSAGPVRADPVPVSGLAGRRGARRRSG